MLPKWQVTVVQPRRGPVFQMNVDLASARTDYASMLLIRARMGCDKNCVGGKYELNLTFRINHAEKFPF